MGIELAVELTDAEADAEELAASTTALRTELLDLDVESVTTRSGGPAPAGSKGVDPAAIGALVVTLQGGVDLVTQVVIGIRAWLGRDASADRSVKLTLNGQTLELTSASTQQQERLVDEFLRSVGTPAG
jgi:hypothetical protein